MKSSAIENSKRPMSMNPKKFAFWLFIVTVAMLFAAFTSAYLVRSQAGDWKLFEMPTLFLWSTVIILLSSVTHQFAYWQAKKDEISRVRILLIVTLALGIGFVVTQVYAWKELTERNIYFAANASHGLTGYYYTEPKFERRTHVRIDSSLNFKWADAPAMNTVGDSFSVMWIGLLDVPQTGEYTFYMTSDNARRLWIDETYILYNTVENTVGTSEGKITLTKGTKVPLKAEYVENSGEASVTLEWSGPGVSRQVIPTRNLWTVTPANASESFLYVITGLHALHIVSALIFLLVVVVVAFKNEIHSKKILRLELCTTYWHFLGLLWVYLYLFLYINQNQ